MIIAPVAGAVAPPVARPELFANEAFAGVQPQASDPAWHAQRIVNDDAARVGSIVRTPLDGVLGEAQRLIDLGKGLKGSAVPAPVSVSTSSAGSGLSIDLSGLNRAYDFAMRTYLLSKVVSEVSGGVRSLWQGQ